MARQGVVSIEEIIKQKVCNFRRWKQTKIRRKHPRWGFQFSIMTYNILSQIAVENHRYLYRHCSNTFLQEDYRISRILPEILNTRSDIICLQELEQHLYDNRIKQLFDTKGFESIFKRRTGGKTDGCAILWRRKMFDLLDHTNVEFRDQGSKYLNRDNVGLIAVLKPNHPYSGNTQLHVATTHLIFNPKRGEVKLCQLRLLLAELERMALKEVINEERVYHPTILCGDFNIEPYSPLYQFMESGFIDVAEAMTGDLSGQLEGKKRGHRINSNQLSLHKLGISKHCRYEEIPEDDKNMADSDELSNPESKYIAQYSTQSSAKPVDPSIIPAIGTSNDPRWLQTLVAMGQEQLASDIATRINSEQNMSNKCKKIVSSAINRSNVSANPTSNEVDLSSKEIPFFHDFKFVPVYKFQRYSDKDMPKTSMTGNDFNTVDHIFYNVTKKQDSGTFSEGKLKLLSFYSLLGTDEIKELGGLPNAHLGSDHLSLIAQFGMNFKRR